MTNFPLKNFPVPESHPIFASHHVGIFKILREFEQIPWCVWEIFHVDIAIEALALVRCQDRRLIKALCAMEIATIHLLGALTLTPEQILTAHSLQEAIEPDGPFHTLLSPLDFATKGAHRAVNRLLTISGRVERSSPPIILFLKALSAGNDAESAVFAIDRDVERRVVAHLRYLCELWNICGARGLALYVDGQPPI